MDLVAELDSVDMALEWFNIAHDFGRRCTQLLKVFVLLALELRRNSLARLGVALFKVFAS